MQQVLWVFEVFVGTLWDRDRGLSSNDAVLDRLLHLQIPQALPCAFHVVDCPLSGTVRFSWALSTVPGGWNLTMACRSWALAPSCAFIALFPHAENKRLLAKVFLFVYISNFRKKTLTNAEANIAVSWFWRPFFSFFGLPLHSLKSSLRGHFLFGRFMPERCLIQRLCQRHIRLRLAWII